MFSFFGKSEAPGEGPVRVSADEFKTKRTDDDVVIDVRTDGEYQSGHLVGAEHIDVQRPDFREQVGGLDRDKTYYLYCRSGNRSGGAAQIMRSLGFTKAYNIGGIGELANAGLEVER